MKLMFEPLGLVWSCAWILLALLLMSLARQVPALVVWVPVFVVWSPPRWGVGGLAGIAPAMIKAERLLFGIDLLFCAAFAFSFWQTYCSRHV